MRVACGEERWRVLCSAVLWCGSASGRVDGAGGEQQCTAMHSAAAVISAHHKYAMTSCSERMHRSTPSTSVQVAECIIDQSHSTAHTASRHHRTATIGHRIIHTDSTTDRESGDDCPSLTLSAPQRSALVSQPSTAVTTVTRPRRKRRGRAEARRGREEGEMEERTEGEGEEEAARRGERAGEERKRGGEGEDGREEEEQEGRREEWCSSHVLPFVGFRLVAVGFPLHSALPLLAPRRNATSLLVLLVLILLLVFLLLLLLSLLVVSSLLIIADILITQQRSQSVLPLLLLLCVLLVVLALALLIRCPRCPVPLVVGLLLLLRGRVVPVVIPRPCGCGG